MSFLFYLWKYLEQYRGTSHLSNQYQVMNLYNPCPWHMGAALNLSVVSDSLWPHGLQPARVLCPWGFSRQEFWSGLPFPSPEHLPNKGVGTQVSHIAGRFFTVWVYSCLYLKIELFLHENSDVWFFLNQKNWKFGFPVASRREEAAALIAQALGSLVRHTPCQSLLYHTPGHFTHSAHLLAPVWTWGLYRERTEPRPLEWEIWGQG